VLIGSQVVSDDVDQLSHVGLWISETESHWVSRDLVQLLLSFFGKKNVLDRSLLVDVTQNPVDVPLRHNSTLLLLLDLLPSRLDLINQFGELDLRSFVGLLNNSFIDEIYCHVDLFHAAQALAFAVVTNPLIWLEFEESIGISQG
jgi:hypothetical protein